LRFDGQRFGIRAFCKERLRHQERFVETAGGDERTAARGEDRRFRHAALERHCV
jgi:hypothetical protein